MKRWGPDDQMVFVVMGLLLGIVVVGSVLAALNGTC